MTEKLNATFFYILEKSIKSYRQMAQRTISDEFGSITVDQLLVLQTMKDQPELTQQQIAAAVFKDFASITRIIDLLVRKGFLKRSDHPTDRRRFELTLTTEGIDLLEQVRPRILKNRRVALEGVEEEEMAIARKVLEKIVENCSK
ncbi:MarR family transcriptional regulator [Flavihumibacter sp. RY-1]|uniref:MarR family transcriptional regulator n=1 Tax=Flavihumibacter fluminis TaxID=2909236 RepID=A0ABS9BJP9_9BACT|nr:MarR family transcriptional regulator [Flavihumibacter fluminis]MCF1714836.1 MarR family transcriptional regulator [Flavihumibacter fluminis]